MPKVIHSYPQKFYKQLSINELQQKIERHFLLITESKNCFFAKFNSKTHDFLKRLIY